MHYCWINEIVQYFIILMFVAAFTTKPTWNPLPPPQAAATTCLPLLVATLEPEFVAAMTTPGAFLFLRQLQLLQQSFIYLLQQLQFTKAHHPCLSCCNRHFSQLLLQQVLFLVDLSYPGNGNHVMVMISVTILLLTFPHLFSSYTLCMLLLHAYYFLFTFLFPSTDFLFFHVQPYCLCIASCTV